MNMDKTLLIILGVMFVLIVILFLLYIRVSMNYNRLKNSYNSFMKGKDGKTLEESWKEKMTKSPHFH